MQPTKIPTPRSAVPLHDQLATVLRKVLRDARLRSHPFLQIWQEKHPGMALEDLCKYCCEHDEPARLVLAIARASANAWEQTSLAIPPPNDQLIVNLCCHMSLVAFERFIRKSEWAQPSLENGIATVDMTIKEAAAITAAVWLNVGLNIRLVSSTDSENIEVVNLISDVAEHQHLGKNLERTIEDEIGARARRFMYPHEFGRPRKQRLAPELVRLALDGLEEESGARLIVGLGDIHKSSFIDDAMQKRLMDKWGVKMFFYGNSDTSDEAAGEELRPLEESVITHFTQIMKSRTATASSSSPVDDAITRCDRIKVFISYARADDRHRKIVLEHLRGFEEVGLIELWDDQQIHAGADWEALIDQRMRECKIAVLLISPAFLGSKFILTNEVFLLLERHRQGGMQLIPVLIRDCAWSKVHWLKRLQMRPTGNKPLAREKARRDTQLKDISEEIHGICMQ
jgi:hypothetical protein